MAGLPACIARLPQISGSLATGASPDNRNDLLADFIIDSVKLNMLPTLYGCVMNITPVDVASYLVGRGYESRDVCLEKEQMKGQTLHNLNAKMNPVFNMF